jgi:transposase-like protein
MLPAGTAPPPGPTCPLCHTVDGTITAESLEGGGEWRCTRCGQTWTAERLERLAAYVRFDAAHPSPLSPTSR